MLQKLSQCCSHNKLCVLSTEDSVLPTGEIFVYKENTFRFMYVGLKPAIHFYLYVWRLLLARAAF